MSSNRYTQKQGLQAWAYGWRNGILRPDYANLASLSNMINRDKANRYAQTGTFEEEHPAQKQYDEELARYMQKVQADVKDHEHDITPFYGWSKDTAKPSRWRGSIYDTRLPSEMPENIAAQQQTKWQDALRQSLRALDTQAQDMEEAETSRLVNKNLGDWLAVYNPTYGRE